MTRVCVASHHTSFAALLADEEFTRIASDARCLIELRVDRYNDPREELLQQALQRFGPERCVVTCRHSAEGGGGSVSDTERASLWECAARAGAAFIDVELRTLRAEKTLAARLKAHGSKLIVSYHDFVHTPPTGQMTDACCDAAALGADVVKLAVFAKRVADTAKVLDVLCDASLPVPTMVIAMGEHGQWTRLVAPRWNNPAPFGFARAASAEGTAPGQPVWEELLKRYRYAEQTPQWPVFGVIGSPIAHSRSPALHNAALVRGAQPGVYVPFLVDDVSVFMEHVAPRLGVKGLSVTLPHKESVVPLCAHLTPLAQSIGAVNTVVRTDDAWVGDNTDAAGAADALQEMLGDLTGRRVVVLGAGGAAKAVAHAVVARGGEVLVCNRNNTRALELARGVGGRVVQREALPGLQDIAALVQATPVGMHPRVYESPLTAAELPSGALIFDTVYNPPVTKLMALAREAGHATLAGSAMFVRQAAAQFTQFTGTSLPLDVWQRLDGEV